MVPQVEEYKVRPRGLLDRQAVETLRESMNRIVAQGGRRITVDFNGVDRALAETAEPLLEYVRRFTTRGHTDEAPLIRLINLPRALVVQLQLADVPVEHRSVIFLPGGKVSGGRPLRPKVKSRGQLILCRECGQTVRVQGKGMFGCPHCGAHFYSDGAGHATFYETLRRP